MKRTKEEGKKKSYKSKFEAINKMAVGEHISTITLNVNRLNNLTKIYRLAEWIQRQDVHVCCPQEIYVRSRDIFRLKVRV